MLGTILLLMTAIVGSGDGLMPTVAEIIEEEGQFVFSDGSSTYQFYDDGTFILEPVGMSGRAIEGTWVSDGSVGMEITGVWSWYNGISAIDDTRMMVLHINVMSLEVEESALLWRTDDTRLYDVYFVIDELVKIDSLSPR